MNPDLFVIRFDSGFIHVYPFPMNGIEAFRITWPISELDAALDYIKERMLEAGHRRIFS